MDIRPHRLRLGSGFTLVELLIVIVVIAILAAITIVAYNGVSANAHVASLKSDLSQSANKLSAYRVDNAIWPTSTDVAGLQSSPGNSFTYSVNGNTYCLSDTDGTRVYYITNDNNVPSAGGCPITDGSLIQMVTSANCPASRVRAVDARDNNTYWVQKLADGKCWMLTNLAYVGNGTNTYGDAKTIANGGSLAYSYSAAYYYLTPGANPTTEPTPPSTSTNGSGQYGYLYNWCAANGAQTGNSACNGSSTTPVDTTKSICPAGWRLPTSSELTALNTSVGYAGLLSTWLGQYSGYWETTFTNQGGWGYYWSSTLSGAGNAVTLYFAPGGASNDYVGIVHPNYDGFSVRCVAN